MEVAYQTIQSFTRTQSAQINTDVSAAISAEGQVVTEDGQTQQPPVSSSLSEAVSLQLQISQSVSASLFQILSSTGAIVTPQQGGTVSSVSSDSGQEPEAGTTAPAPTEGGEEGEEQGRTRRHGHHHHEFNPEFRQLGKALRSLVQTLRNFESGQLLEALNGGTSGSTAPQGGEVTQTTSGATTPAGTTTGGEAPAPTTATAPATTGSAQPTTGTPATGTTTTTELSGSAEMVKTFEAFREAGGTTSSLSLSSTVKFDFVIKTQNFAFNLLNAPTDGAAAPATTGTAATGTTETAPAETPATGSTEAPAEKTLDIDPRALRKFVRRAARLANRLEHLQDHASPRSIKLSREITHLLRHAAKLFGEAAPQATAPTPGTTSAPAPAEGTVPAPASETPAPGATPTTGTTGTTGTTPLPTAENIARYGFTFELEFNATQTIEAELTQTNDDGVTVRNVTVEKSQTFTFQFSIEGALGTLPATTGNATPTPAPQPDIATDSNPDGNTAAKDAATTEVEEARPQRPEQLIAQLTHLRHHHHHHHDGFRVSREDSAGENQPLPQQPPQQSDQPAFRFADYLAVTQQFQFQFKQDIEVFSSAFKSVGEGLRINPLQIGYRPIEVIAPVFEVTPGPDATEATDANEIIEVEAEVS